MYKLFVLVVVIITSNTSFSKEPLVPEILKVEMGAFKAKYAILNRVKTFAEAETLCKTFEGSGRWELPNGVLLIAPLWDQKNPYLTIKLSQDLEEVLLAWVKDPILMPATTNDDEFLMYFADSKRTMRVASLKNFDDTFSNKDFSQLTAKDKVQIKKELVSGISTVCVLRL